MLRVLLVLSLMFAAAAVAAWFAGTPGTISYDWNGYAGTISTTEAAAVAFAGAVGLCAVVAIFATLARLPKVIAARRSATRARKADEALTNAVVAVGSGDATAATRMAAQALAAFPDSPVATFIAAQAAQLSGDPAEAERQFTALAADPRTRQLGLRGLAVEAERAGDLAAARTHARAALETAPGTAWAADLALRAAAASGDFSAALKQLAASVREKLIDKRRAQRLRAVLLTARALSVPGGIKDDALEAHNLAKELVPAALAAAAAIGPQNPRQAASILSTTYKRSPHPDLFRADLDLAGQSATDRLARAKPFAALRGDHVESALGLSRAALAARELDLARETLAPFAQSAPSQRVCLLMAEIEALTPGADAKVRHFLAKALRAPRDPVWIADGVVAAAWAPISPVTGAIDAFEWRVPEALGEAPALTLSPRLEALPAAPAATDEEHTPSVPKTAAAPQPKRLPPRTGPFGPIPDPTPGR